MSDRIVINLPSSEVRKKIIIGVGLLIFTGMAFFIANLWSENQALQEQLTVLKKPTNANPTPTAATATSQDKPAGTVPAVTADDRVEGNRNASVMLVEYSDLECPFCKRNQSTVNQLKEEYGDKIGYVYRHYPLSIHANAQMEAEVAECVANVAGNDAFFTFIHKVFADSLSTGTSFTKDQTIALASNLGFDGTAIAKCYDAGEGKARVAKDLTEGSAAGVQGTPATFVLKSDGTTKFISGALPIDTYREAIDALLQ